MPDSDCNNSDAEKSHDDLPKARFWDAMDIAYWQGFWFEPGLVGPAAAFRSTFAARDDDVLLASTMKTGTTWLKSLALCILGRADLLATDNPHFHVPTIESTLYSTKPIVVDTSAPRLLHTHLPYSVLPESVRDSSSACKIVYIARNPKDTLVSMWHFFNTILRPKEEPFPVERVVECFCSGVHQYGPFFDHVAEYWAESQRQPDKILFLRYEEVKANPVGQVWRIAEFLGRAVEAEEVVRRCSLERLKNLEVNRSGSVLVNVPNWSYFRKGEVGDWKNYLTPEMEERIDQMSRTKLEVLGLFL